MIEHYNLTAVSIRTAIRRLLSNSEKNTPFLSHLYTKTIIFTKTGSGQT
jgi:hypothetical protein